MPIVSEINPSRHSVAIVGWHDGAAGQIDSWIEKYTTYEIACFVNPSDIPINIDPSGIRRTAKQFSYPKDGMFKGRPLISSSCWATRLNELGIQNVLVISVDEHQRFEQIGEARCAGLNLINAIHPSALVLEEAILHDNVILHARAIVGYRAEVYPGVIIDTNAQIDHHNVIRDCATIDPGVVFAGNVTVDRFAVVHTGSVVINRIWIGENAVVGAGSTIIRDVPPNVTVVGSPGRIVKYH